MPRSPAACMRAACMCLLITIAVAAQSTAASSAEPKPVHYTAAAQADRITSLPGLEQAPDFGALLRGGGSPPFLRIARHACLTRVLATPHT